MHYILMFSLLSAPYLLHINVKSNKQIEAKHFHSARNTFEQFALEEEEFHQPKHWSTWSPKKV